MTAGSRGTSRSRTHQWLGLASFSHSATFGNAFRCASGAAEDSGLSVITISNLKVITALTQMGSCLRRSGNDAETLEQEHDNVTETAR